MRPLTMVTAAAALVLLAACAGRQVEATPPTVTYSYGDDGDYYDVEQEADTYCAERYGANAVLVERSVDDGGQKATFACE